MAGRLTDWSDSMNGITEASDFVPSLLPIRMNEEKIALVMERAKQEGKWVMCFIIGTKPCLNKFYGAVTESIQKGLPVIVVDSNQHYDPTLTHGLKEFDYLEHVVADLNMRGDLAQKSGEIFFKLSWFAKYLKKKWPTVTVVPVINGDVITAAIAPAAWMFSRGEKGINMESGLRSMTPQAFTKLRSTIGATFGDVGGITPLDVEKLISDQFYGDWKLFTNEPYPEQWDTFVSSKGCQYHFAPLELNRQHLLREGHDERYVYTSGAVVIDAWKYLEQKKPTQSIFSIYPQLEQGDWIRLDIHRKENLTERRFKSIIGGMKLLVEKGHQVNFVEMNASRHAINMYGLQTEIEKLKTHKNFLHTPLWPEFSNVLEFYKSKHCLIPLTDSGGLQEDMNYWRKPCLTLRLSTDRPETVMTSHSNLLVPPVSAEHVFRMTDHVVNNSQLLKDMANATYLYGQGFGKGFSERMAMLMKTDYPFHWSQDDLGLWQERSNPDF